MAEDLSRLACGVYLVRCSSTGAEDYLSGKLSTVMDKAEQMGEKCGSATHDGCEHLLHYLDGQGQTAAWAPVDAGNHKHYHGEQRKLILQWFYERDAALSRDGVQFMANLLGVSHGRLRNAIRTPVSPHYQPFSGEAMTYLTYRFGLTAPGRQA